MLLIVLKKFLSLAKLKIKSLLELFVKKKKKVDLSNYATKAGMKNISQFDTSGFALKSNLANLKTEVDKLDISK